MKTIKTASLFSGIGAIEYSYKNLNINHEVIFGCDIEPVAEDNFIINHNPYHWYSDIFDIQNNKENYNIDILLSSAPCVEFSLAKMECYRDLNSVNAKLSYETINLLKTKKIQTKYLVFENVSNLVNIDNGNSWRDMLKAFNQLEDYHPPVWKIINSNIFSATSRERVFLVLSHKSVKAFSFPELPSILHKSVIRDHLEDISTDYLNIDKSHIIKESKKPSSRGIITYGRINQTFNATAQIYDIDGKCPTITASHSPIIHINGKLRHLTIKEIASIMNYPKDMILNCSFSKAVEKIGNSIEIKTLEFILKSIIEELNR